MERLLKRVAEKVPLRCIAKDGALPTILHKTLGNLLVVDQPTTLWSTILHLGGAPEHGL